MSETFEKLSGYLEKAMAIQASMVMFEWDNETLAPKEAAPYTSRVIGSLSEQYMEIMTSEDVKKLVEACGKESGLTETEEAIVREAADEIEKLECIPAKEYREFTELTSKATRVWAEAKKEKDFKKFAPILKEIVDYQKKFASYRAKEGQKLYDVMLDSFEKGFDMENLDQFFDELKKNIVPMLHDAAERSKKVDDSFLTAEYPVQTQEEVAHFLAEYVGLDFDRGVLAVSAHPFTTNLHNHDVRITTHYGDKIDSSIFSVIHETGHALYELGIRDDLTQTLVGQGASMGMHECQSRFFENIIGRNKAFWEPIYDTVADMFGVPLKSVSLDAFINAVNKTIPGLIRTEADELSYALHVLVRYEIEKMIIEDNVEIEKLPEIWNKKYEEYLGVRPENDAEGILQDIHWSQGSFGYFPSYALGSAFGAQIYHTMKQEMDVEELLREGKLEEIRKYLRDRIHQYGKLKNSRQILKDVTGEDFSLKYYIEYLREKYGAK
ncbi:carboxypeptidase M32 [[Clostridium] symbiosum]|uniref:carboxypeptidase M32 n=1 Tax=Clostridium symbiosum TaxID=1512 RepID=UPI001D08A425|nr:carboxypeptidase M32 [[Clostridium] symbiosum]MCB6609401.1 carboxypeptidase M32 [[Clostridium] symbiosum]MCB6929227.1 carboxypeptidase M32 [[Clostridium] symbiosum]